LKTMIAVVIAANRVSPIPSTRACGLTLAPGSNDTSREGEDPGDSDRLIGRHLMTASTEARQGCT
ncbi:MAG: hypothetical protein Q9192_005420, partial [Flavoplaca navasiana]